jgi:plastocyanin
MKVMSVMAFVSIVGLAACGGGGDGGTSPNPVNPGQKLATIRVTNATVSLNAGSSVTITAQALDAAGAVITSASGYTFTSSAPTVAEVQSDGAILGIGAGTATITASLTRDGVTATSTATVTVTGTLPAAASVVAGDANNTFTPPTLVVARNANVTFTFGALQHNVTFGAATGAPANIPNTTAASLVRTFTTAGDFAYDCTLHAGMTGKVVVR